MLRSEVIKNLLNHVTHKDLADLYNPNMEVQVNVAQDGGDRIEQEYLGRRWHGWTDGISVWKSFRIPLNAKTIPENNDTEINFDLAAHTEGIGLTGWDWVNKVSRWVAFDFDAISGHSDRHEKKLKESELQQIRDITSNIPWITTRYSTGGQGLHLYVMLDPPVPTENHSEHAAVARAVLGLMSSITAYNFQSKVDICGGNMWFWHRKMINNPNGLKLIKQGVPLNQVPQNWRDHIKVVSNRSRKVVPKFITDQEQISDIENMFQELTGQKTHVPLDSEHQKLIKYLHENNCSSWWDQDNHMLVAHTFDLHRAFLELKMKGLFKTLSKGTEQGVDHNCFLYPLRQGAWVVRRYSPGCAEESTWDQDAHGWTRCYLNREPDLQTSAKSLGGLEQKKGGFYFDSAELAVQAASQIGVTIELPSFLKSRAAKLSDHKSGKLMIEIEANRNDPSSDKPGWLREKDQWYRLLTKPLTDVVETDIGNYDDMVRHLNTELNEDSGWLIKSNKDWRLEPLVHVRTYLKSLGLKTAEIDAILGSCISKPWRLVCRPFQPEIIGDRDWNRNAPQLAFVPSTSENLNYPTWLKILNHCGKGLDDSVKANGWAKANAIFTGADYLKCWIASLFKEPTEPLPYLFFYNTAQNTGKSIFHEALALLLTTGYVRAENALINPQGFNAELENAVLCVVEEINLGKDKVAAGRIKDWVTSRHLPIHRKNQTPYSVRNTTHWIQCANGEDYCQILSNDTRITMIFVDELKPHEMIPKRLLIPQLEKEAPDFLAAILSIELPESPDRLNLPVIDTADKKKTQEYNMSYLELFIKEVCHYVPGKMVTFTEFYDRFQEWADTDQLRIWTKIKIGRSLPKHFPKGKFGANVTYIGNMSFTAEESNSQPLKLSIDGVHLE